MSGTTPEQGNGPGGRTGSPKIRQALVIIGLVAALVGGITIFNSLSARSEAQNRQGRAGNSAPTAAVCEVPGQAALVPASGALFGVNLDWHAKSLGSYAYELGHKPAVNVTSAAFPYNADGKTELERVVVQVRAHSQIMLLTLEPSGGLVDVTPESAAALAADLAEFNNDGVPVLVRFAPEMNGSWNLWSQQPGQYVQAFRTLADAVHKGAPGSGMMWAPGYGAGYPFAGGQYEAKAGTPEFAALDTDADGALTMNDDPYAPYYPGDDAVDWVGMSLYHWGAVYPWGENELPEPTKFADQLTGNYAGDTGEETLLPDFYQVYGVAHGKPVAITETAALFVPGAGGADELAIKQAWWGQVFDPATAARFPQLKMINWFEWEREEPEINGKVDWAVVSTPAIRSVFKAALPDWLRYGPARSCEPRS